MTLLWGSIKLPNGMLLHAPHIANVAAQRLSWDLIVLANNGNA